jgi:glycosyltransferase involved in cell wall biosynthesis
MRIVLITFAFPPIKHISSNRPYKLAKYLLKAGHEVTVISSVPTKYDKYEERPRFFVKNDVLKIIRIKYSHYQWLPSFSCRSKINRRTQDKKGTQNSSYGTRLSYFNFIKQILKYSIDVLRYVNQRFNDFIWYLRSLKILYELERHNQEFDVIFTTSPILGTILIGNKLKKIYPNAQLINDFRDSPFLPSIMNKFVIRSNRQFLNTYLKRSNLITVISHGIKESFVSNWINKTNLINSPPIEVIYNGFDKDDIAVASKLNETKEDKLLITYTGTLYNDGRRNCSMLFDAICSLINKGLASEINFEINYAGNDFEKLIEQANQFHLKNLVYNKGFLTQQDSFNLQASSDCLMVLTWNNKFEKGILTGKLAETLLFKKKLIGLVTGDVPHSELENLIQEYNLGFSGNYVQYRESEERLERFLLERLYIKCNTKVTPHETISEECLLLFDYEHITGKLLGFVARPQIALE